MKKTVRGRTVFLVFLSGSPTAGQWPGVKNDFFVSRLLKVDCRITQIVSFTKWGWICVKNTNIIVAYALLMENMVPKCKKFLHQDEKKIAKKW